MKTKTKALALFLSAVLLVVTTVFTTMAFLTSETETVKNTFTVGKVAITLDEARVNEYGELLNSNGNVYEAGDTLANRVPDGDRKGNEYKLIPGHEYVKDPTVHVKLDSEDCYVRMEVTVTVPEAAKNLINTDINSIITGYNSNVWERNAYEVNGTTITYDYWYKGMVDVSALSDADKDGFGDLAPLFTKIVVPEYMDVLALYGLKIDVVAYAIQADGFDDAADAWAE